MQNPTGVTNATAGEVAGLNAVAEQLLAAANAMPLATTVPIPLTGQHTVAAAAPPGGYEQAVVVPLSPALPEHFSEVDRYSSLRRETTVHLVTDPLTGATRLVTGGAQSSQSTGSGGKALKAPDALAKCLAGFPAYCLADQLVETALTAGAYTVAGYSTFRQAMLRLAKRVNCTSADDWRDFLVLDRTLRLIQHQERLPWTHEGGHMDNNEVTIFVSMVAARAATGRMRPQPRQATTFRQASTTASNSSEQPDRSRDCFQFWHNGPQGCKHGKACKFEASHKCKVCGSSAHGTAQHSST